MIVYPYDDVVSATLNYFEGDDLATNVWITKYALKNKQGDFLEKTPDDMHNRLTKEFARIENDFGGKRALSGDEIYSYFKDFKYITPQGSPMYGIGNEHSLVSLSNCFEENTKVYTINSGVKKIKDVLLGDSIVTHKGNVKNVSRVYKNKINDSEIFKFKVYRSNKITATGNHKFLSLSKEQQSWGEKPKWNEIKYLRVGDWIALPKLNESFCSKEKIIDTLTYFDNIKVEKDSTVTYSYKCLDDIITVSSNWSYIKKNGDIKKLSKKHNSVNRFWKLDNDFAFFIGLWYGDGCVFSDNKKSRIPRGITFTFNKNEKDIIDFVSSYGEKLFGIKADVNYHNKNKDNSVQIVFGSTYISYIFNSMFGRGYSGKFLNNNFYDMGLYFAERLLAGLVSSDGTVTKDGQCRVSLKNVKFINELYHYFRSYGMPVGISKAIGSTARIEVPIGSDILKYIKRFYNDDRVNLALFRKYNYSTNKGNVAYRPLMLCIDGVYLFQITEKENVTKNYNVNDVFYNLEVEDDHSYCVEGLICKNCTVISSPLDKVSSIMNTGRDMANLFKRRAGVGVDISTLRPEGATVNNSAGSSTGSWSFSEIYSLICRRIGQGGRRGALILTLDVRHPDIFKFVTMKRDLTKITGANISVKLTDKFMEAVVNDDDFTLKFPIDSNKPTFTRNIKARELWDVIINSATKTAEPGILMWDTVTKNLPAHEYEEFITTSTNPCSELPLSSNDSCRLIAINLKHLVENSFSSPNFDGEKFKRIVSVGQRLSDDLIQLEIEKLNKLVKAIDDKDESELWKRFIEKAERGRRTGLGTYGLADCLARMCIKYDSNESLKFIDDLYTNFRNCAYAESVKLSKERGPFPAFNWETEKNNVFISRLPSKLISDIEKYGRRNISLLTMAPTGSVSLVSKTSSGIEPVFRNSYTRRRKVSSEEKGVSVDFVDESGDSWAEFKVLHENVKEWVKINFPENTDISSIELPNYFVTSDKIDWHRRVEIQGIITENLDHSVSSCLVGEESLVLTDKGFFDIKELCSSKKVGTFSKIKNELHSINSKNNISRITEGYNNGLHKVYDIKTECGYTLSATGNHRLQVLTKSCDIKWKYVKDLVTDDFLVGRVGLNLWGSNSYIPTLLGDFSYKKLTNSKNITIPKLMTLDLARFLGYLCSAGGVSINGIFLSQEINNVVDDFIKIVNKIFNVRCKIQKDNRTKNLCEVVCNSRELAAFVKYLGITTHDKIRVPKVILMSGKECVKEFIKGVTLDGYISTTKDRVIVAVASSISKHYLSDIQQLLLNLGINSCLCDGNPEESRVFPNGVEYKTKKSYVLSVYGEEVHKFANMLGFAENRKQIELEKCKKQYSRKLLIGKVPVCNFKKRFREEILVNIKSNKFYDIFHSVCGHLDKNLIDRNTLLIMNDIGFKVKPELLDSTYVFRKITLIENTRKMETYDISVPDGHSYVANGFVSHNTINLPKGTLPETVSDIYMEAWKKGCKGITVYVDGSRTGVLIENKKEEDSCLKESFTPKRPESVPCDIHQISVKGNPWVVLVGKMIDCDGEFVPYEVFAGESSKIKIPKKYTKGSIVKRPRKTVMSLYDLLVDIDGDDLVVSDIVETFGNDTYAAFTRVISLSLRSGAPVRFVVEQLQKDKDSDMYSFSRACARVLKKYIKDGEKVTSDKYCSNCKKEGLIYSEGCILCTYCGWSKCA